MAEIINQILKLPLEAFVFGMQMLAKTVEGMQKLAESGIDVILGKGAPSSGEERGDGIALDSEEKGSTAEGAIKDGVQPTPKEERKMADNSLSNDKVKVVQYTILSIKPDDEHALEGFKTGPRTRVVTDNMTGADFSSWVIAEYFQEKDAQGTAIHLREIAENDKKYLRVSYTVVSEFEAEDANYPKEQVDVLRQIATNTKQIAEK